MKASQATKSPLNLLTHDCDVCDGGHVDLYIAGEYQETITCPECRGTGKVTAKVAALQQDSRDAFNAALADEQYKY